MNRRRFIQSLAAVFSLAANPTLLLRSATTVLPAAAAIPAEARSWAVYMSTLHGECTPHALQVMLNISAADAKKYVTQLIADGVIKSNPLLQKSVSKFVKTNEDSLLDKVKKRLEMKRRAGSKEVEFCKNFDETERLDAETELLEDLRELGPEAVAEDEPVDAETQVPDEICSSVVDHKFASLLAAGSQSEL